ncbi:hypothetical protein Ahy_B02g058255 [Arachis hypogaea]|uniref:Uncharacterized protein n=1 Tax=Arachis hypogaea TaxID=3818 RepID=A0A445AE77_ARAHY|nr:hypothetical protein Ahy_B02g058255 [Arachis hypogaea]
MMPLKLLHDAQRLNMLLRLPKYLRRMKIMIPRLMRLSHEMIMLTTYMPNKKLHKDTDYWSVVVVNDGVTKRMNLSIKEAIVLPPSRHIILEFNTELQPISQATGLLIWVLTFNIFPLMKRTFQYEEDDNRKIKRLMIQRIEKIWKESRKTLFHKFYDERKNLEENTKHKPLGINAQQWKWFFQYRLKDSTKTKYSKSVEATLYIYWGLKTLARRKDEEEKAQQRHISRGEEALAKMVPRRRPHKMTRLHESLKGAFRTSQGVRVQIEEYQKEIKELKRAAAELKAEAAEEKAKR